MHIEGLTASRTDFYYKDRLFKAIFADKARLLSLYNVLNGSNYTNIDGLEITTLKSVIYFGMKNDLSFLINDEMSLYEKQSSYNLNMHIAVQRQRRMGCGNSSFFKVATHEAAKLDCYADLCTLLKLCQMYLTKNKTNLYSSRLIKIPTPKFIVFYNGIDKKDVPDIVKFKLSDAFMEEDTSSGFGWTATMLKETLI